MPDDPSELAGCRESSIDLRPYVEKMRRSCLAGTDHAVDARFVDMLASRNARILDIGCGIGSAVAYLRAAAHEAFGIDASPEVLAVAAELHDPEWFRLLSASSIAAAARADVGLPTAFDVVLLSGNVPAFLSPEELSGTFALAEKILTDGGRLVVGTTTKARGGPADLDSYALATSLRLSHRYGDWHLGDFRPDSPWSVSVFTAPGKPPLGDGPDGMFLLPPRP